MSLYDEALAAFRHGDNERARELSEELRSSGREVDGLCMLARVALREGDAERTRELAEQAQETARALGDRDAERMPIHLRSAVRRRGAAQPRLRRAARRPSGAREGAVRGEPAGRARA